MGNCSQQANSENTDIKEAASSKRTSDNNNSSSSSVTANSNNNDNNDKMIHSLPQPTPPPYSKGSDKSEDKNASKDRFPPKPPVGVGGEERKGQQEALDKAASRIQRQIRKSHSVRAAKAAQQWKLFADLDTQDEAEMLHLAVFMQTLIDTVPGVTKTDQEGLKKELVDDESNKEKEAVSQSEIYLNLESIQMAEKFKGGSADGGVEIYEIGHGEVTSSVAADIVEVYRRGGKLSRASIVKILRRTYKIFLRLGNISRLTISDTSKLTVVGDIHGQLPDLLHILDEAGLPNVENRFIFNGDFVDRGEKGLEVIVILFALFVAEGPEVVSLNRGNHEDLAVCRVYGFENEVKQKYDDLLFEMFAEVFNHMPLFSIANDSIFVVHGGLFHNPEVSMEDLEAITRHDYFVKPPIPYPHNIVGRSIAEAHAEYLKQLQRDALWSDPTEESGCYLNPRGAGVSFGPDIAEKFMKKHNFSMVIRSHECIFYGFDLPYLNGFVESPLEYIEGPPKSPEDLARAYAEAPLLCTLFSASNYIGGNNFGAFVQFATHPFPNSRPAGQSNKIHYLVKRFKVSSSAGERSFDQSTHTSLAELILRKQAALISAFEAKDKDNSGQVSRVEWAEVMQRVTGIKIRWLPLLPTIAPPVAITSSSVLYRAFLSHFSLNKGDKEDKSIQGAMLDDMYGQRKRLEQIFRFFDTNGDGVSLPPFSC